MPKHLLSASEVERVMTLCEIEESIGLRDRAILEVIYSTGMRRLEIVRLKLCDLSFDRGLVLVNDLQRRKAFCDELCRDMIVHPVSPEIAQLAGRMEGEQVAQGIAIAFEDLVIVATALHLGFDVATFNVKHFKLIPGLKIVTL